jgi:hypothetical protein
MIVDSFIEALLFWFVLLLFTLRSSSKTNRRGAATPIVCPLLFFLRQQRNSNTLHSMVVVCLEKQAIKQPSNQNSDSTIYNKIVHTVRSMDGWVDFSGS